ncbi:helix-turn-helix and ligand-binding sensor domain-containing protein [Olivibacter sitiensis]|uniref:helix-turn-helix and ligand-binding sensor domain-containing protein n=1 Tax=Olivibacter sitiensis TaxID=376470 RepID=UPI00146FB8B2|nr:triple tyrosine motif-containing protein [Olivibacter sitiensis]
MGMCSYALPQQGTPLLQNYTKAVYKAENQNWSTACAPNGEMFFGNNAGLLHYDGAFWHTYYMPGNKIVRSIAIAPDGRVYAGAHAEFGFWEKNSFGKYSYTSLSRHLKGQHAVDDEVWKIYVDGDRVFFQSFSTIYVYEDGKIRVLSAHRPFLFLLKTNGDYFIEVIGEGLHRLNGDNKLLPVKGKELIGDSHIMSILPFGENYLVGTSRRGLYLLTDKGLFPWHNEANEKLQMAQLNNGLKLDAGYFVFGTILDGVFIIDDGGKLIQHINKNNGLQNNSVLSLGTDMQGSVWLGLDNGIDRIEVQSPLSYYANNNNNLGTVYTTCLYNGAIYVGTNQGLYVSAWESSMAGSDFDFQLIPHTQGQVWDLSVVDGELLCGHNSGTFRIEGNKAVLISKETGGYMMAKTTFNDSLLIQGTYTNLTTYRKNARGWQFAHVLEGYQAPAQFIQLSGTTIWASSFKGLYKLQVDSAFSQVLHKEKYDEGSGLPKSLYINVFGLEGRPIFATEKGFYLYDDISNRFSDYTSLNKILGTFASSNKVIPAGGGNYWFVRKGKIAKVSFASGGRIAIDSTSLRPLESRIMAYYENINTYGHDFSIISLDDGFAIYREAGNADRNYFSSLKPQINRVEYIGDSIPKAYAFLTDSIVKISNRHNNILISYAIPFYAQSPMVYQYKVIGYNDTWSTWQGQAQRELANLPVGVYQLVIRAKNANGLLSKESTLHLEILPPWYRTGLAYCIYCLLLILLGLFIRKWYMHKLDKHQLALKQKLEEEQRQVMLQKQVEAEKREAKFRNEQLERELAIKNRELANSSMNIVYKNELLNNIHEELMHLKDEEGRKLSNEHLRKINKIIEDARSDERDWIMFEESFNEAHGNFFKKLKTDFPQLLPNDLKLCAYLRMNMSSKEVASLLNITTRGVEIRRYRLRKKLNLHTDQNLSDYLMQV